MTSNGPAWSFSPNKLKKVADLEFALGVNRFEIHEASISRCRHGARLDAWTLRALVQSQPDLG